MRAPNSPPRSSCRFWSRVRLADEALNRVLRVRKFRGRTRTSIDPHWDFEHSVGESFDSESLRIWKTRIAVTRKATARLKLKRIAPAAADLVAHDYMLRHAGGSAPANESYER